jgi:nicotinate-nucleotide pyrophosphorylase (carboxylating)
VSAPVAADGAPVAVGGARLNRPALAAAARAAARRALAEDLAGSGDVTGRAFSGRGRGRVVARQAGVLSGTAPFLAVVKLVDGELTVSLLRDDGDAFAAGDTLVRLDGDVAAILALERTGLNFLSRLSGVATLTAAYVAETNGTRARIAATRKTTPGLRVLEKAAVVHGGGLPHRLGLFDAAMIKDNHVRAAGGVQPAIDLVRAQLAQGQTLEVEVESPAELDEALAAGVTLILLDNMDLDGVRAAVAAAAGRAVLEVSGGVGLNQVRALAETGVDIISVGALTTRAPWIDLSLDLE